MNDDPRNKSSTGSEIDKNHDSFESVTPPLLPSEMHTESISEHLSSVSSIENDHSYQEIEISNVPLIAENNQVDVTYILDEILASEQFQSEAEEESFNLFQGVNLNDTSLLDYRILESKGQKSFDSNLSQGPHIKELEDLLAVKDVTIAALTAELESLKEVNSNHSTLSTSTTEYRQYHDEYRCKLAEFQNAIAHRDNLIEQLTESLQQSLLNREQLCHQSDNFAKEIASLQKQVAETEVVMKQHQRNPNSTVIDNCAHFLNLDDECSKIEETLSLPQLSLMEDLKSKIHDEIRKLKDCQSQEVKLLNDRLMNDKNAHDNELDRLRDLLAGIKTGTADLMQLKNELDVKHSKEMEELRTYFEGKCADLEKHYSEEIFSQHSRKMSGSSTSSEVELSSDLLFSAPHPGPAGDPGTPTHLNRNDFVKLKSELNNVLRDFEKYDLETVSKQDLINLKFELSKYDLRALTKCDLSNLKNEIQNKCHAELEILREDYDNKIDLLNVDHENKLKTLERKYVEKIENLKYDLGEALRAAQENVVQEVASSGEYELAEVVQSYERRLQEQVTLAKIDIVAALEHQIQMLVSCSVDDAEWPSELLQLRDKFTEKYEAEIADQNQKFEEQLSNIKKDHNTILSGALDRARRRSLQDGELDVIKERDHLKKTAASLRHLVGELMKYFMQCEDELNNTLVEKILKHGFDRNLTQIETELNMNASNSESLTSFQVKRVHFTPNFFDLMPILDSPSLNSLDLSVDVTSELKTCLSRLKSEANAILAITSQKDSQTNLEGADPLEAKISSLTRKLITENQIKNDLLMQLDEANKFIRLVETEGTSWESQRKILEADLLQAKNKIAELVENGHKEIVSEGYGEKSHVSGLPRVAFGELQERARNLIGECSTGAEDLVQIVEELCKEGELLVEEGRKDRFEMQQQVDAADKKLRATCGFLEEQAIEREQERDEAQKTIAALRDQLKERDKDRVSCERINKEVEQLELQMREMSKLMEENDIKYNEIESERTEAVDKIWVLRDIIKDLESQVETKRESENQLKNLIEQLKDVIDQQNKNNDDLSQELDQIKTGSGTQKIQEHIGRLEEEVQRLRLNSEFVGDEGTLEKIKIELCDIEAAIDRGTRELEALHSSASTTNCSSPSEDMSVRDQIRPNTPSGNLDECDVPLQQLARLREKLVKHSRMEDAAVKRIKDLEMQLVGIRRDFEEVQSERDVGQDQIREQLVLISSLQMRLDVQRIRTEHVQKETNTSLEVQIYDLQTEIQTLTETIQSRDKTLKQLNKTLEEMKKKLHDQEREFSSTSEDKVIDGLQKEIEYLKSENVVLQSRINNEIHNAQMLPTLVDNIIADKNKDIEKLQDKLDDTQKQLDKFLSLNLDRKQLHSLSHLRSSDRAFGDILSLIELEESERMRKQEEVLSESVCSVAPVTFKVNSDETVLKYNFFEPELSSIERIGPNNCTAEAASSQPNSTKRVHFEDSAEIADLKNQLSEKLNSLVLVEENVNKLQEKLDVTEEILQKTTQVFEREQEELQQAETNLKIELAEKKLQIVETSKRIEFLEQDGVRKDQMYMDLAREKRELDKLLEVNLQTLRQKEGEVSVLQEKVETLQAELDEMEKFSSEQVEMKGKLDKELSNKLLQIDTLTGERQSLMRSIENLEVILRDHESEAKKLNQKVGDYQKNVALLQARLDDCQNLKDSEDELQVAKNQKEMAERGLQLVKLSSDLDCANRECAHLTELVGEKDKIINQMSEDSKSLHTNLETIQNRMQETGNILDLNRKLLEEQQTNAVLQEEIMNLRARDMSASIDEITGQVKQQLDYSALLDSNILTALSSEDLPDNIDDLKEILAKELATQAELLKAKRALEIRCEAQQEEIFELKVLLESEQQNCEAIQLEDGNMIEKMRIRLEDALEMENEFDRILQAEQQIRRDQDNQSQSNSKSETEYKNPPNLVMLEMEKFRSDLSSATEENRNLLAEMKNLKRANYEYDANLKYVKDMLGVKDEEVKKLETRIDGLMREGAEVKERCVKFKCELEQKSRETENSRILIAELEQEKSEVKNKIKQLEEKFAEIDLQKNRLQEAFNLERERQMRAPVPDDFLRKMRGLTIMVKTHCRDKKKMDAIVTKLTDERTTLQGRIKELEEQNNIKLPFDDPIARANHLFGRYLKSESYRKALIWQKKYLMALLATYQIYKPITQRLPLSVFDHKRSVAKKSRGQARFRVAGVAVIAVLRMQFLVQRWHSGRRIDAHKTLHILQPTLHPPACFQVGQPVSTHNFQSATNRVRKQRPQTPKRSTSSADSWSGTTPPAKDSTSVVSEKFTPLETSVLMERFDLIQQRLGIAPSNPPT